MTPEIQIKLITALAFSLPGVLFLVYGIFTAKKKGPILLPDYILATKAEQEKMDKNKAYKMLTVMNMGIAVLAFLMAFYVSFSG